METIINILTGLGWKVTKPGEKGNKLKLLFIRNTDGTVRWFWPSGLQKPLFLKFYNIQGAKGKFFAWAIQILFHLRLQRLFFPQATLWVESQPKPGLNVVSDWACFTGTPGPNRKGVLYTENLRGNSFIKVAIGEHANLLLKNEAKTLWKLQANNLTEFRFPESLHYQRGIHVQSNISGTGKRLAHFTHQHVKALTDLRNRTISYLPLNQSDIWKTTLELLQKLNQSNDTRLPGGLLRKLTLLTQSLPQEKIIQTSLSHGDFTPWNTYVENDQLAIYDWEMGCHRPIAYDAFHFIIQQGILVDRKPWKKIKMDIQTICSENNSLLGSLSLQQQQFYLQLYLVINVVYYLQVYRQQENWHTQINWLIETWNDACSDVLKSHVNHRALAAMDLIDFLRTDTYAALKYKEHLPEHLSAYSDLDICIEKKNYKRLVAWLTQYPLLKKRNTLVRSFMATEQLIFQDGSVLNIDFVWKFKRKELVMFKASDLLAHTTLTKWGVRVPRAIDNARYVALFYALNKKTIPEQYAAYAEPLVSSTNKLDQALFRYFKRNQSNEEITRLVKQHAGNRGMARLINTVAYLMDVYKQITSGRGMTVTFSGVDGAGKSTMIENIALRAEKQLRKRVVVLRHRPSMLPILSVWTKGKEAAHKDAAGLPRLGTNKSMLSSLLRFAYYYTDYSIGQVWIYLKYILRGYVVLYDRYYFDFINDSKRSNIVLPQTITRLGYNFLLKPELNFFLYANPDVILARKQELTRDTIEQLTDKYCNLFQNLDREGKQYIAIENLDLQRTSDEIFERMLAQNAA